MPLTSLGRVLEFQERKWIASYMHKQDPAPETGKELRCDAAARHSVLIGS